MDGFVKQELVATADELRTCRPQFHIQPDMTPGTINDGVTFELYRLACLIYIEQAIDPSLSTHNPSIQTKVHAFIMYLSQLPSESASDGFLCWPLVVVGLRAVERTHRAVIAGRLKTTYDRFRSKIFSGNLALLKRWWREGRNTEGGGDVGGEEGGGVFCPSSLATAQGIQY
ncbi:fungal-specific transcription factor domain-containing protein [Aspergillus crustosus]